jgi:acyl carrier protein
MNIHAIVAESFNMKAEDVRDELVIRDLEEWDSMAHMFFITRLEEAFGVDLTGDEIEKMQRVEDVKRILEAKAVK